MHICTIFARPSIHFMHTRKDARAILYEIRAAIAFNSMAIASFEVSLLNNNLQMYTESMCVAQSENFYSFKMVVLTLIIGFSLKRLEIEQKYLPLLMAFWC